MGAFQSNDMKEIARTFNENIINQTTDIINSSSANCTALQTARVQFGGLPNCTWDNFGGQVNVNISNILSQECNLTAEASTDIQSQISTVIENGIRQTLTQESEAVQNFLTVSFGVQLNYSEQITDIVNRVETNINTTVINTCALASLINQNSGIVFCGTNYADINVDITQNATQIAVGYCIANNVFRTILTNDFLNKIIQNADQKLFLEQGLSIGAIIGIVIAALVVVAAVALGVYFGIYAPKKAVLQPSVSATSPSVTSPISVPL